MKRYQEIELEKNCKKVGTFLKHLEKQFPNLIKNWGELIQYNFENGIQFSKDADCGYILHTIADDNYFYISFIATAKNQVIEL